MEHWSEYAEPKHLNDPLPFRDRLRLDCEALGSDNKALGALKLQRVLAYIEELEARVARLEDH